jgi:hypothetical protein
MRIFAYFGVDNDSSGWQNLAPQNRRGSRAVKGIRL